MKIIKKILLLFAVAAFLFSNATAQQLPTNATLGIQTLGNAGQVFQGSVIDVQIQVSNNGSNPILGNKVRTQLSLPIAIVSALSNAQQTGLPPGWIITSNTGGVITICNGSDIIPPSVTRTALIKIQGNTIGGPSIIQANLQFGPGTAVCTGLGTLPGDLPADNSSTSSVQVLQAPNCNLAVTAAAGTILCNGGTTTLTATPTGNNGAVEYSITGGATFQLSNVFNVPAGTYTVLAREVNNINCSTNSSSITITQPIAVPTPILGTVTQPTCAISNGTVQLNGLPTGNWIINPGNISGTGTTTTINNLAGGSYSFTVTNVSNCTSSPTTSVIINAQPTTPSAPIIGTITQPTCTAPNGSVVLNGLPAGNWTINPGAITGNGTTTTINNLTSGVYNFIVTNADGCTSAPSANINIDVVTGIPPAPTVNVVQPTCITATGIITVTSITTGLTFSLDNGPFLTYPTSGYTVSSGTHSLKVQTVAGCISNSTTINIDLQPPTPLAPAVSINQPTCTFANGIITVSSSTTGLLFSFNGGPYTVYPSGGYVVGSGNYTLNTQNSNGCTSQNTLIVINNQLSIPTSPVVGTVIQPTCIFTTGSVVLSGLPTGNWVINPGNITGNGTSTTINGLATGSYNFTVTNVDGCISTGSTSVVINSVPGAPSSPTVSIVQPTCNVANGIITITSTTTGLTFSLDGATPVTYPTGGYVVAAGLHTLVANNAADCNSAVTNITINAQPPTPATPTLNISQPTCTSATGNVIVSSVTSGLTFSLDGGIFLPYPISGYSLSAGNHNLSAQNSSGCISPINNFTINAQPPTPPTPTVSLVQPTCSNPNGIITITSSTTGLTFSLDGGSFLSYPIGGFIVASGNHSIIAKNSSGCNSFINTITINQQPATPTSPIINITQPTCSIATGSAIITSTTTGLTFSIDGGSYVAYPLNGFTLSTGIHSITAQNAAGCISSATNLTINAQPTTPSGSISAGIIACNGGVTTLTVTATGGVTPYEYSLNGGAFQTNNTFSVVAGTYSVTIRGANLCTVTTSGVTISQPTALTATATVGSISCNGGTTTLTVNASGGIAPLQYSLNGGVYQTSNTFSVSAGNQMVTIRDANLCTKTANVVTINQPNSLIANATAPRIKFCGGSTIVTISATGGNAPYTGIGTFTKGPGISTFSVTDANGCIVNTQINIEAPGCMNIRVFPNPARNSININHSLTGFNAIFRIYDMKGSLVLSKTVAPNSFLTNINISNLINGLYILVLYDGDIKKQVKFEIIR